MVCEDCLPEIPPNPTPENIYHALQENGNLKNYSTLYKFHKETQNLINFFTRCTGFPPWGAQKTWLKRVIREESFAITASTGIGKTTFGAIASLYMALKGGRSYIILPTKLLVQQVVSWLEKFRERMEMKPRIAYFHSGLPKREREKIERGEFDILVTTSQFLARNFHMLEDKFFKFIFIDDVDSLLKSSKNIDKVLKLLGFTDEIIKKASLLLSSNTENPEKLREEIQLFRSTHKLGFLIVSSATGRPKGRRIFLYNILLDFTIGSTRQSIRNITDIYVETIDHELLRNVLSLMGNGALIYLPVDRGLAEAESLVEMIRRWGYRCEIASSSNSECLTKFSEGTLDVLVGVATYYGVLVRGIDLPHRVKYTVFYGIPKFRFKIDPQNLSFQQILQLLHIFMDILEGFQERKKVELLSLRIRKILHKSLIKGSIPPRLQPLHRECIHLISSLLKRRDVLERLKEYPYSSIQIDPEGFIQISIPDVRTYIQASGRASRLFAGGVSKGCAILFIDDEKVFRGLSRSIVWYYPEASFRRIDDVDLKSLMEEIERDRKLIRNIMNGKIPSKLDLVKTKLMIVESPNKAKTIANFFGKPSTRRYGRLSVYEVNVGNYILLLTSTGGHIYDLVDSEGIDGILKVDGRFIPIYSFLKRCKNCNFQFVEGEKCPRCGGEAISKGDIVRALQILVSEVDDVYIATDPDREGEAIAWNLLLSIKPYANNILRSEFHEVTLKAIRNSIECSRQIDQNLVDAQIARRIEDRWIGYGLSRLLWRRFNNRTLSAGRVQTPILGWVIERAEDYKKNLRYLTTFRTEWGFTLNLEGKYSEPLDVEIVRFDAEKRSLFPPPPYTTDTLLSEASRILHIPVNQVMQLAQDLFQAALITYHRTDSTRVSDAGISLASKFIKEELSLDILEPRRWGEGGAHECIRPTRPLSPQRLRILYYEGIVSTVKPLTRNHLNLYTLIFKRFIASQMKPVEVEWRKVLLRLTRNQSLLCEVTVEGSEKISGLNWITYLKHSIKEIPRLRSGSRGRAEPIKVWRSSKVPLLTQSSLIQLMKERRIGRPSTYAKIVNTLLKRKYVKEDKFRRLHPTSLGKMVYKYLSTQYGSIVSENMTRRMEENLDMIEEGALNYQDFLSTIYEELRSLHTESS